MEYLDSRPARETVLSFLRQFVTGAQGDDEICTDVRQSAQESTRIFRRALPAIEELLAQPSPPGDLARLVGWEGNWVLDDPSDAGAARFLGELADMLREVLAEAG